MYCTMLDTSAYAFLYVWHRLLSVRFVEIVADDAVSEFSDGT